MKSLSDINDKKLNVIVSVCLLKSENDHGIYKLLVAKLQKTIPTGAKNLLNNNSTTTAIESSEKYFQIASPLIMLHRLHCFCQHKQQKQQQEEEEEQQQRHYYHHHQHHQDQYQVNHEPKVSTTVNCRHQQQKTNINNSNTKSTLVCNANKYNNSNNFINNIEYDNILRNADTNKLTNRNSQSNNSRTAVSALIETKTPTTNRLSSNYCIKSKKNNNHRISNISHRNHQNNITCSIYTSNLDTESNTNRPNTTTPTTSEVVTARDPYTKPTTITTKSSSSLLSSSSSSSPSSLSSSSASTLKTRYFFLSFTSKLLSRSSSSSSSSSSSLLSTFGFVGNVCV